MITFKTMPVLALVGLLSFPTTGTARKQQSKNNPEAMTFDMTAAQPVYNDSIGYGLEDLNPNMDNGKPFFFSVKVADGNYRVKVTLGSRKHAALTTVRAESRRLFVENAATAKGKYATYTLLINKRDTRIPGTDVKVKLRSTSEMACFSWDDKLTLEFNGIHPAVKQIEIERDTVCPTIFLCGNSTVVDQHKEPYASWGQMLPRFLDDSIAVANYAQSGETASSFIFEKRLQKIGAIARKGDYVLIEFGHNDMKEKGAGKGAWYNFSTNMKTFVDVVRAAGATPVFVTPTQRRRFDDNGKIQETHGDYPAAMAAVAQREHAPLIDLHQYTRELFETMGPDSSVNCLVHFPAHTYPNQSQALKDNTHFRPFGAYEVAKCVCNGMKEINLPIAKHIISGFSFHPTHPDAFSSFRWFESPFIDVSKPEGN